MRGTDAPGRPFVVDGVGAGWRPEIAGWVADVPDLGFCEVIAESVAPAGPPRGAGGPACARGAGRSRTASGCRWAAPSRSTRRRVAHLAACADALGAPLVSEHIAFVRAGGRGGRAPAARAAHPRGARRAGRQRRPAVQAELTGAARAGADRGALRLARRRARRGRVPHRSCSTARARCCCWTWPTSTPTRVNRGRTRGPLLDRILDRCRRPDRATCTSRAARRATTKPGSTTTRTPTPCPTPVLDLLAHARASGAAGRAGAAGARRRLPTRRRARRRARRHSASSPPVTPEPRTASLPFQDGESPFSTRRVAISGTLAARQAALVAALVAGAPDPPGFDPARLAASPPRAPAQAGG